MLTLTPALAGVHTCAVWEQIARRDIPDADRGKRSRAALVGAWKFITAFHHGQVGKMLAAGLNK
jgi:hypothetical protein